MNTSENRQLTKLAKLRRTTFIVTLVPCVLMFLFFICTVSYSSDWPTDSRGAAIILICYLIPTVSIGVSSIVIAGISWRWPCIGAVMSFVFCLSLCLRMIIAWWLPGMLVFLIIIFLLFLTVSLLNSTVWWLQRQNRLNQLQHNPEI